MNQKMRADSKIQYQIADLCMSLGIHKTTYTQEGSRIISHMPLATQPYRLSHKTFGRLITLHQKWQELIVKVAADTQFVSRVSASITKNDPFMNKFWNLYLKAQKNGDDIKVACTRIDYMGDEHPQLVEFNLMSVGLNGNSDNIQKLGTIINTPEPDKEQYPISKNQSNICQHLLKAIELNKRQDGIIVMVVHLPQFNFGDQNYFKLEMARRGKIVVSLTMDDLIKEMVYDEESRTCYYGQDRISAFYFRTGYSPAHFPTEKHWEIKEQMQLSNAVKLPSVDMIIVNSKRMQAQLAKKEVLIKYLGVEDAENIADVSGEIYDFDDLSKTDLPALIQKMKNYNYVLKPNREGGGNNFFAEKAYEKMLELQKDHQELQNYIVMKSIESDKKENYFIFDFQKEHIPETTAELSTFGCFIYKGEEILENKYGGFLVRLKKAEEKQGGVAINKGALASLCLTTHAQQQ